MRTPPKQHADGLHEIETREPKPDEDVHATPSEEASQNGKPREPADDFSVLLHLGLV